MLKPSKSSGQALSEYSLVLVLVSVAAISALGQMGTNIENNMNFVASVLETAGSQACESAGHTCSGGTTLLGTTLNEPQ